MNGALGASFPYVRPDKTNHCRRWLQVESSKAYAAHVLRSKALALALATVCDLSSKSVVSKLAQLRSETSWCMLPNPSQIEALSTGAIAGAESMSLSKSLRDRPSPISPAQRSSAQPHVAGVTADSMNALTIAAVIEP
jgi:hypothetical protein